MFQSSGKHVVGGGASRLAFTLAEVLVTLGIIGVISAMTLPTLVKNHQRQVYVTQLKATVNLLSQAAEKAINDNNAISLDETKYNSNDGAIDFFNDYLKVVNNCGTDFTPCFASSYKNLDGSDFTLFADPSNVFVLANGVSILFGYYYRLGSGYHGHYDMQVDVNGAQGPNIVGRDLFHIKLYSDGKVAETYNNSNTERIAENCGDGAGLSGYGGGCLTKIMNDGWKMDY